MAKRVRGLPNGVMGWMNRDTKDGTLERIEPISERTRGEGAEVKSYFWYTDGTKREDTTHLLRENGRWRVTG